MLRTFEIDEEIYKVFKSTCDREGDKVTKKIASMIEDYVKEHSKSNNPQTVIEQFDKESILAVPNVYKDETAWLKFYDLIKKKEDYKQLDEKINMIYRIHNRKFKDFA